MRRAVGIDVGGTKTAAGVVTEAGEVVFEAEVPTPKESAGALVATVADLATELVRAHDAEAVGIGAAGFVQRDRSTVRFAPHLPLRGEDLGVMVAHRAGAPVVVENDANAMAWAEARHGAGRGASSLVAVTVGTGIGGGIVLGGELVRGASGAAAEFGHVNVVPDGHPCPCGERGCLEQYASGSALTRYAQEATRTDPERGRTLLSLGDGTPEGVSGRSVTRAAFEGDPLAKECLRRVGEALGRGLAGLTLVLDPEVFVVGGGVIGAGELLLAPAREALALSLPGGSSAHVPPVHAAQLGNRGGMVGAADLALRR